MRGAYHSALGWPTHMLRAAFLHLRGSDVGSHLGGCQFGVVLQAAEQEQFVVEREDQRWLRTIAVTNRPLCTGHRLKPELAHCPDGAGTNALGGLDEVNEVASVSTVSLEETA